MLTAEDRREDPKAQNPTISMQLEHVTSGVSLHFGNIIVCHAWSLP